MVESLKKCKLIHNLGIGYEGLDVKATTEHGICVSTLAYYCLKKLSDHTTAPILAVYQGTRST